MCFSLCIKKKKTTWERERDNKHDWEKPYTPFFVYLYLALQSYLLKTTLNKAWFRFWNSTPANFHKGRERSILSSWIEKEYLRTSLVNQGPFDSRIRVPTEAQIKQRGIYFNDTTQVCTDSNKAHLGFTGQESETENAAVNVSLFIRGCASLTLL